MKLVYPGPEIKVHAGTWVWTRGKVREIKKLPHAVMAQLKEAGIVEAKKEVVKKIQPDPKSVIAEQKAKVAAAEAEMEKKKNRDKDKGKGATVRVRTGG